MKTTDGTGREPVVFANYNGDVAHIVGRVTGPNPLGVFLVAVEHDFDPEEGRARVGFVEASAEEISAEIARRAVEERGYGVAMPS